MYWSRPVFHSVQEGVESGLQLHSRAELNRAQEQILLDGSRAGDHILPEVADTLRLHVEVEQNLLQKLWDPDWGSHVDCLWIPVDVVLVVSCTN